jgi:hypothetical protein
MTDVVCWRCGTGLEQLSLPLSRLDECPECVVHLHVCRMCQYFDPAITKSCSEDDAEEVRDKQAANFCDYFKIAYGVFDKAILTADQSARQQASALFGAADQSQESPAPGNSAAEDLFGGDED